MQTLGFVLGSSVVAVYGYLGTLRGGRFEWHRCVDRRAFVRFMLTFSSYRFASFLAAAGDALHPNVSQPCDRRFEVSNRPRKRIVAFWTFLKRPGTRASRPIRL